MGSYFVEYFFENLLEFFFEKNVHLIIAFLSEFTSLSTFLSFITSLSTFLSSITFFSPFFSIFLRLSVQRNIYVLPTCHHVEMSPSLAFSGPCIFVLSSPAASDMGRQKSHTCTEGRWATK